MTKQTPNRWIVWAGLLLVSVWTVGCGPVDGTFSPETNDTTQNNPAQLMGVKQYHDKAVGQIANGHPCPSDAACQSGKCIDPGMGRAICTQECDLNRACSNGFACHHGACVPGCQNDNDCDKYPASPICVTGGVCWRDGQ